LRPLGTAKEKEPADEPRKTSQGRNGKKDGSGPATVIRRKGKTKERKTKHSLEREANGGRIVRGVYKSVVG